MRYLGWRGSYVEFGNFFGIGLAADPKSSPGLVRYFWMEEELK